VVAGKLSTEDLKNRCKQMGRVQTRRGTQVHVYTAPFSGGYAILYENNEM